MTHTSKPWKLTCSKWIIAGGITLVLEYILFVWAGIRAGIGSLDAHDAISAVEQRLQTGNFYYSRPPGHPLDEYWALPSFTWLVQGGQVQAVFNPTYGLYLLLGGLACITMYGLLLRELKVTPVRGVLAAACLAFSPQYLGQSLDGEEFLWSIAFFFAAVVILLRLSCNKVHSTLIGWGMAFVAAIASSGYRLEFGAVIIGMVALCLLISDQSVIKKTTLIFFGFLLFLLLWLPLYYHQGLVPPSDIHMNFILRAEASIYKCTFLLFGVLPVAFLAISFFQNIRHIRVFPVWGPGLANFLVPFLAIIFFPIYALCPQKVAGVLPSLACLLAFAALYANRVLWIGLVMTSALTLLVHFDCYENHSLTGLRAFPSLWRQELDLKPAFQGFRIANATQLSQKGSNVVITRCWPWDFSWQQTYGGWAGSVESTGNANTAIYFYRIGNGVVTTRSILDNSSLLKYYTDRGYTVWLDQDLYREVFLRYTFNGQVPEIITRDGISFHVIDLTK